MKRDCVILMVILALNSCSNNKKPPDNQTIINEKRIDSFFPVTSFIKGQIITLDSLPVTPLQITTIKKKTDSLWLPKKDLKPLLVPFLNPVIDETGFTKYFKETRFNDLTLNAITFTYDLVNIIPDSITLRHWDVYVDPETGKVVKVYIVKKLEENNKVITQQLTWQTNTKAKISTILNNPDGTMELLKEVTFIWNFN